MVSADVSVRSGIVELGCVSGAEFFGHNKAMKPSHLLTRVQPSAEGTAASMRWQTDCCGASVRRRRTDWCSS